MSGRVGLVLAACVASIAGFALVEAAAPTAHGDAASLLERGNQAYEEGAFAAARDAYLDAIERGAVHETAFYNLGCAHARLGEQGEAVLAFRRALWLDPGHEDARANLAWMRGERGEETAAASVEARERLARWTAWVPVRGAAFAAVAAEWIGVACLLGAFVSARRGTRRMGLSRAGAALFALALLVGGAALVRGWLVTSEDGAVVLASRVEARSGPGASQQALFTLHEGHEVDVVRQRPRWLRVRTGAGDTGWIPRDSAALVELAPPGR